MSNLHGGGTQFISAVPMGRLESGSPLEFVAVGNNARKANQGNPVSIILTGPFELIDGRYQPSKLSLDGNVDTDGGAAFQSIVEILSNAKLYDRVVEDVNPQTLPDKCELTKLAQAMRELGDSNVVSGLPALYTYFGQFMAHDITHMRKNPANFLDVINFRSHAFDLDSLFDDQSGVPVPNNDPYCKDSHCVGSTRPFDGIAATHDDLPRTATGVPCLPDERNDNNLSVSQLTVAIIKFHQVVCGLRPSLSDAEKEGITRAHIQSIALHDYLPKLIDARIYNDVIDHGRAVIYPGFDAINFRISFEFATACFRFGHSMVRNVYRWGTHAPGKSALLRQTLHLTNLDGISDRENPLLARLPANWVADLNQLLVAQGTTDTGHLSSKIDAELGEELQNLKIAWFDTDNLPPGVSEDALRLPLAQVTLLRGLEQRLPTSQELFDHMDKILSNSHRPFGNLLSREQISGSISSQAHDFSFFWDHTPLWFYILAEARVLGSDGSKLGPMAGRIVMETLHAAIAAAKTSIISADGFNFEVLPEFMNPCHSNTRFSLGRMLDVVAQYSES